MDILRKLKKKEKIMQLKRGFKKFAAVCAAASVLFFAGCSGSDGSGGGGETRTINGIECVYVAPGTFMMGATDSEDGYSWEYPRHQVTLTKGFWISKYEITQKQYRDKIGSNPSYFIGDNKPVETVSWNEAADFCAAVGGRLPTEAEWEFAARGGNKSKGYIYSGSNNVNDIAWYWDNIPSQEWETSGCGSQPVGTKSPNELGIYDMIGNVWEWVSDWYGDYSSSSVTNPTGPNSGSYRVIRGGSWHYDASWCRVAFRDYFSPSNRSGDLGFRAAFNSN
jgi:formylglycine-generating enzyme required for sulfatase activity